jgi:hypothetical protein
MLIQDAQRGIRRSGSHRDTGLCLSGRDVQVDFVSGRLPVICAACIRDEGAGAFGDESMTLSVNNCPWWGAGQVDEQSVYSTTQIVSPLPSRIKCMVTPSNENRLMPECP